MTFTISERTRSDMDDMTLSAAPAAAVESASDLTAPSEPASAILASAARVPTPCQPGHHRPAFAVDRVGIGIDGRAVRVVVTRGGEVVWASEEGCPADTPIADVVTATLHAVPLALRRRFWGRRPVVVACIGGPFAQVKHLVGIPPVADRTELARLLLANAGRFFRKGAVPLLPIGARPDTPGRAWAAMVEAPLVDALTRACRQVECRLVAIAPTLAALGHATMPSVTAVPWSDDGVGVALAFGHDRMLVSLTRAERYGDAPAPGTVPRDDLAPPLTTLGIHGWQFADAYAAAIVEPSFPLVYRVRGRNRGYLGGTAGPETAPSGPWAIRLARLRMACAGAACVVAAGWSVVAPDVVARQASRAARRDLVALGPARVQALRAAEDSAREVVAALASLDILAARRGSVARVLAAVAGALPRRATLVSFACDSAGGTLVALAPRAASVVAAVEAVPYVREATIVGAITRDVTAPIVMTGLPVPASPMSATGYAGGPPGTMMGSGASPMPRPQATSLASTPAQLQRANAAGEPEDLERVTVRFRFVAAAAGTSRRTGGHP